VNATEAAERRAEELGVDITAVEGSGQGGRVVVGDVDDAAESNE
jgi:pyruvate/2-oxoglutarate dehydrogenase complex dihydrolipoamide acyltransferase (E2) component